MSLGHRLVDLVERLSSTDPFKTGGTPQIKATRSSSLNTAVIPLFLLNALDYEPRKGYPHHKVLMVMTYFVEERLEEQDVPLNRYDWTAREYQPIGKIPYSRQFLTDLHDGLAEVSDSKPVLLSSDSKTYDGSPRRYYTVTGYTDLYIQKYFKHTAVELSTVEDTVNELVDELPEPSNAKLDEMRNRLVEQEPETYF